MIFFCALAASRCAGSVKKHREAAVYAAAPHDCDRLQTDTQGFEGGAVPCTAVGVGVVLSGPFSSFTVS